MPSKKQIQARVERLRVAKAKLHAAAAKVSEELGGARVVVVAGGSSQHGLEATLAGWANIVPGREARFRDILGILQSAIQIESFLHYMEDDVFQDLKKPTRQALVVEPEPQASVTAMDRLVALLPLASATLQWENHAGARQWPLRG